MWSWIFIWTQKEEGRKLFMAYVQYLVYKYCDTLRQTLMLNTHLCVLIKSWNVYLPKKLKD